KGKGVNDLVLVVCNFTPVPRSNYRIGVPRAGFWREVLNSDAGSYGGSGYGNLGGAEASPLPAHGRYHSLSVTLPPLAILFFRWEAYPPRTDIEG
ncbi:MAG: alpha amylase C-terminal domain-containing protein, partial [Gammaproteobacteria bacterium]